MRHQVFGRQLGRTEGARALLFRNLAGELIMHGRVKTTIGKAKALRPFVEKFVTKAKKATLTGRREILATFSQEAGAMLLETIAPKFADRKGGFSRIIHLGERAGDSAEMVILEWTEQITPVVKAEVATKNKPATKEKAATKGKAKIVAAKETPEEKKKPAKRGRPSKKA